MPLPSQVPGKSGRQPRLFALSWIIYLIILVATTFYVYARLDYVRSGPPPHPTTRSP